MNRFTDYRSPLDQAARNRRARLLRGARRSARSRPVVMLDWTDAPVILALVLAGALALACDRSPVSPMLATPNDAPSENQLRVYHALAVGDPDPQAAEHMPWCIGYLHCTCSGWGGAPGDTTTAPYRNKAPYGWDYDTAFPPLWGAPKGWQY
jgi:hypothetical protein